MPFSSVEQEYYLMINHPDIWKKWLREHGHAKGWNRRKKKTTTTRKSKRKKR